MACCCFQGSHGPVLFLQVCDEPHPLLIREMIKSCTSGEVDEAYKVLAHLWYMGYAAEDIITNIFRVCKNYDMSEYLKLEFIKVSFLFQQEATSCSFKVILRTQPEWPRKHERVLNPFFSYTAWQKLYKIANVNCIDGKFMKIMIRQNVYPKAIISDLSAPGSLFFFKVAFW